MTDFMKIYDCFLGKITDDMYLEWTATDTLKDLQNILLNAIPDFEFPRFKLYDYILEPITFSMNEEGIITQYFDKSKFQDELSQEEINILALCMVNVWVQRQLTSIENTRMKYSGPDFKMTSQANHLSKLISLKNEMEKQNRHMQRLYNRRKINENGTISSNWSILTQERVIK